MECLLVLVGLIVWAALYLGRFTSHNIEGWRLIQVMERQEAEGGVVESPEVLRERAACARIADEVGEMVKGIASLQSVATEIRMRIEARNGRQHE